MSCLAHNALWKMKDSVAVGVHSSSPQHSSSAIQSSPQHSSGVLSNVSRVTTPFSPLKTKLSSPPFGPSREIVGQEDNRERRHTPDGEKCDRKSEEKCATCVNASVNDIVTRESNRQVLSVEGWKKEEQDLASLLSDESNVMVMSMLDNDLDFDGCDDLLSPCWPNVTKV